MPTIGQYLLNKRNDLNMSLKKVQIATGITDSVLCRIENGTTEPTPLNLKLLSDLYKEDAISLFIKAGYLNVNDLSNYQQYFKSANLLGDAEKDIIQNLINQLLKNRNSSKVEFRLGELFCGPGGIAVGATTSRIANKDYSIIHQWANDFDATTCETYRHNICPNHPETVYQEDIRELDMSKLAPIDALAFGFPCNDFSIVGEQKGLEGTYGPLYSYGVKALKLFQPKWFLAENVGGLRNANDGEAFKKILSELKKTGYIITPHLYKFEEYGVPQARHRLIIVGIRSDLNIQYHVPSTKKYQNKDNSCRTAIEVPPIPKNAFNNELTNQSPNVVERLQHILPGQNAFTANIPERLQLKVKGAKISQIYKRLDPDKPSYTITGSGGGGTHVYHWKEPRALTNRERARLQTFPDNYEFIGNKGSVRKQIGMAVPCKGVKVIFEAILNSFAGISYDYIKPNIRY